MSVDNLSQDFLKALLENGGKADMPTIRKETGMSRGKANHRFRKLSGKLSDEDTEGWIDVQKAQSGKGNRTPPKVAVLNEKGEQAIRKGEAGARVLGKEEEVNQETTSALVEVTQEDFKEFQSELDGVKNQLNVVVDKIGYSEAETEETSDIQDGVGSERMRELEEEVERLRQTVEMLSEVVGEMKKQDDVPSVTQPTTSEEISEEIEKLRNEQEYLSEWMDVAEAHLIAFRSAFDDELDVNMEAYLDEARDNN